MIAPLVGGPFRANLTLLQTLLIANPQLYVVTTFEQLNQPRGCLSESYTLLSKKKKKII